MRWAAAALLLWAAPLAAQQSQAETARRLVFDASRALQAGNAARFLGYFDKRETPGFGRLRENVLALLAINTVASSVEVKQASVEDNEVRMTVDWLMQLTPADGVGPVEQRREQIEVRVRVDQEPKIISLVPNSFLRPPTP